MCLDSFKKNGMCIIVTHIFPITLMHNLSISLMKNDCFAMSNVSHGRITSAQFLLLYEHNLLKISPDVEQTTLSKG